MIFHQVTPCGSGSCQAEVRSVHVETALGVRGRQRTFLFTKLVDNIKLISLAGEVEL